MRLVPSIVFGDYSSFSLTDQSLSETTLMRDHNQCPHSPALAYDIPTSREPTLHIVENQSILSALPEDLFSCLGAKYEIFFLTKYMVYGTP